VGAIDLTKVVEGRLTLVMERVGGKTLRQWLAQHPTPGQATQRKLAEDLLSGIGYLEQEGVTHKDLKPDNLLVADGRLVIIDFSLAEMPEDAAWGGTALYRDPAGARWSHATDRFAAALCLFELYAGRHAFDGRAPEPGQEPQVGEDDIAPSGLAAFFRKALDPVPERRFPSARAMREALLLALGEDVHAAPTEPARLDTTTPLRLAGLSRRALNALARCRVHTVGELLELSAAQIRAIHAIGTRTAGDIIALQESLRARGVPAIATRDTRAEPTLVPDLCDSPEPVDRLRLGESLRTVLIEAGLHTVGAVASLTQGALLDLPGIGRRRLADVVEALHSFRGDDTGRAQGAHTLDRLWERASHPLSEAQRVALERSVGVTGEPESQSRIAEDLHRSQPQISLEVTGGLERVDIGILADLATALDTVLDGFGGIARLDEVGDRLEEEWPAGIVSGAGMVRLLARLSSGRVHLLEVDGADQPAVARPLFDRETLRAFTAELVRLASQWPPVEPDTARRTLTALLPQFEGDPLALGVRLCQDVEVAETGHLFVGPLEPRDSIGFVLQQVREPIALEDLERRVRRIFGINTPLPDRDHLLSVLADLDCQVHGDMVLTGRTGSLVAPQALPPDALPPAFGAGRSPQGVVRDMLREAAATRGFRMVVAPPEWLPEIGHSVATALAGTFLSFEDAFFTDHRADLPSLERAERFVAQRDALSEAAEATLSRLLEEHGRAGRIVVLGDTALFGLCEVLDLPRRLYDETLSGNRGFWVVVVPGVIHNRQPRFNEGPPMWHLEGATLPLLEPLPP
jgi:hypothetical protein